MFRSKPPALARVQGRSSKLHLERLEDRLQPGSILPGLAFFSLADPLPDFQDGLPEPQENAAESIHYRTEIVSEVPPSTDLTHSIPLSAGNRAAQAVGAPPAAVSAEQALDLGPASPRIPRRLALRAGSAAASKVPAPGQLAANGSAITPMPKQEIPGPQPLAPGNLTVSHPAIAQSAGKQPQAGVGVTAVPIPAHNVHPMTASVIAHVTADDSGQVRPFADIIFTTYISNSLPVKTGDGRGYSVAVA